MSDRSQREFWCDDSDIPNAFSAPVLALSMWHPVLLRALSWHARAQEGFGLIASEWQEFVGRRLHEDAILMHRLALSSTVDECLVACASYWDKAAQDYSKEAATVANLIAGVTGKMAVAAGYAGSAAVTTRSSPAAVRANDARGSRTFRIVARPPSPALGRARAG